METPNIGQLITDASVRTRDAIHVAVIPCSALSRLNPGRHLKNGIVDPFLTQPVEPGQRFWLFIYPNMVRSLRHYWEHDAFPNEVVPDEPPVTARLGEAGVWAALQNKVMIATLTAPPDAGDGRTVPVDVAPIDPRFERSFDLLPKPQET